MTAIVTGERSGELLRKQTPGTPELSLTTSPAGFIYVNIAETMRDYLKHGRLGKHASAILKLDLFAIDLTLGRLTDPVSSLTPRREGHIPHVLLPTLSETGEIQALEPIGLPLSGHQRFLKWLQEPWFQHTRTHTSYPFSNRNPEMRFIGETAGAYAEVLRANRRPALSQNEALIRSIAHLIHKDPGLDDAIRTLSYKDADHAGQDWEEAKGIVTQPNSGILTIKADLTLPEPAPVASGLINSLTRTIV